MRGDKPAMTDFDCSISYIKEKAYSKWELGEKKNVKSGRA